jgi:hypothetical protein
MGKIVIILIVVFFVVFIIASIWSFIYINKWVEKEEDDIMKPLLKIKEKENFDI